MYARYYSRWGNPPPPPDVEPGDCVSEVYFYMPETNPVVNKISEEKFKSVIHLLDQATLETPPESEDEIPPIPQPPIPQPPIPQPPIPQQPGQIMDVKVEVPVTDDASLDRLLSDAKNRKQLPSENVSPTGSLSKKKKKAKSKSIRVDKKKKKKQHKDSEAWGDTVSHSKIFSYRDSSSASSSNTSSPSPEKAPQLQIPGSIRSLNKSSSRPKSPNVFTSKRYKPAHQNYVPPFRRSASSSRSPDRERFDERRYGRRSPRGLSPSRKSSSRRYDRPKSSRSRRSTSPLRRRSPNRWSPVRSPSRSPRRRSFSRSPTRRSSRSYRSSSRRRSPSSRHSRRICQQLVTRPRSELPKRYGSPTPERNIRRKSPFFEISARQKSPVPSPKRPKSASPVPSFQAEQQLSAGQSDKEAKGSDSPKNSAIIPFKIQRITQPGRFNHFQATDDYGRELVEYMKNRVVDNSDNETNTVDQQPALTQELETPLEESNTAEEASNPLVEDQAQETSVVKSEKRIEVNDEISSGAQTQNNKEEGVPLEQMDLKGCMLNSYYCSYCQLTLNSDVTWQSHINGKKHRKIINLQTVHEIAKGSIQIPSTPKVVSEDIPRFAKVAAGKRRFPIGDLPRLQPAIDCVRGPVPGLDCLEEYVSDMDVNYYCQLCDAPCGPSSVMPHLIGFKHQLRCVREIDAEFYEKNKSFSKKSVERALKGILMDHELRYGRGRIKVYREQEDPSTRPIYDHAGPSWRNIVPIPDIKKEKRKDGEPDIPLNDECLDTSKADFFCKLCDSHMNNVNMWEAHVRGKRHLKNAKKIPGENVSKVKSVKLPNAVSTLESLLRKHARGHVVVGLDFIRETRGMNGEIYNCFLCGSCSTNLDIVDHVLLTKHRTRYLEKMVTNGNENGITMISQMDLNDIYFRENLILDECRKMVDIFGEGKVEVYAIKK